MRTSSALLLLPPLLCGAIYLIRAREHAALRSQIAVTTVAAQVAEQADHEPAKAAPAATVRERLCRTLATGGYIGPEEALLLLRLADPPDAALVLELAKTASILTLEPGERRKLEELLKGVIEPMPDEVAAPALLAVSGDKQSGRSEWKERLQSWSKSSPATLADWLEQSMADGSLRVLSARDQEELTQYITPLRLIADPSANLERIRSADSSMQDWLFSAGLKFAKTPADRRTLAAAAFTLPKPRAVSEALALLVKDSGVESTAAWLATLPGMEPAARTSALEKLATSIPGHANIADNVPRILSQLLPDQHGEFAAAVTAAWADRDHEAAAKWINSSRGAAWQDYAREAFARRTLQSEPASALIWAASIGEAAQRASAAQDLFDIWQEHDAAAARAFLQSPECPETLRSTLNAAPSQK